MPFEQLTTDTTQLGLVSHFNYIETANELLMGLDSLSQSKRVSRNQVFVLDSSLRINGSKHAKSSLSGLHANNLAWGEQLA